jgi:hypothetical protein
MGKLARSVTSKKPFAGSIGSRRFVADSAA